MMPLHQDLELSLDIGALGVGFKAEHVERAALGIENLAHLGGRPLATRWASVRIAKQAEGVVGGPSGGATCFAPCFRAFGCRSSPFSRSDGGR